MQLRNTFLISVLILLLSIFGVKTYAEEETSSLILLPVLFYTPETKTGGGFYTLYLCPGDNDKTDLFQGGLTYTQKEQIQIYIGMKKYIRSSYKFLFESGVSEFPDKFYGIGNSTTEEMEEDYTLDSLTLEGSFLRIIQDGLYLGPNFVYADIKIEDPEEGGVLDQKLIRGSDDTSVRGLGLHVIYDKRDNQFFPERGFCFEVKATSYPESLGNDNDYFQLKMDQRNFFSVGNERVIAIQSFLIFSDGDLPFQLLPQLGGVNLLRGYYQGRYRDNNLLAFQGEYRFPINKRFRGAIFAGIGDVACKMDEFKMGDLKTAGGFGLRYAINEKEKINIRLDIGFNNNGGSGVYFCIGEAY